MGLISKNHRNGGGMILPGGHVDHTAFLGKGCCVHKGGKVTGNAIVKEDVVVGRGGSVEDEAQVTGQVTVINRVYGNARIFLLDSCTIPTNIGGESIITELMCFYDNIEHGPEEPFHLVYFKNWNNTNVWVDPRYIIEGEYPIMAPLGPFSSENPNDAMIFSRKCPYLEDNGYVSVPWEIHRTMYD